LREGAVWRQESIIGTVFEARYRRQGRKIVPTIRGRAYITGETEVLIDPSDPLAG
jgi:4-hydroxyproline epimerase